MLTWHHQLNGHEVEQTPGGSGGWEPGMLQSMGCQRVRHDLVTEQQQFCTTCPIHSRLVIFMKQCQQTVGEIGVLPSNFHVNVCLLPDFLLSAPNLYSRSGFQNWDQLLPKVELRWVSPPQKEKHSPGACVSNSSFTLLPLDVNTQQSLGMKN